LCAQSTPAQPSSSIVEIALVPVTESSTLLTLVHRGLPLPALDAHREGWNHYIDRLTVRAAGGDPGPDPIVVTPLPTEHGPTVKVVTCACGQQWHGTDSVLIELVERHGRDVHNMPVTPEQVLAMAVPVRYGKD
jgi:hypothetical protein